MDWQIKTMIKCSSAELYNLAQDCHRWHGIVAVTNCQTWQEPYQPTNIVALCYLLMIALLQYSVMYNNVPYWNNTTEIRCTYFITLLSTRKRKTSSQVIAILGNRIRESHFSIVIILSHGIKFYTFYVEISYHRFYIFSLSLQQSIHNMVCIKYKRKDTPHEHKSNNCSNIFSIPPVSNQHHNFIYILLEFDKWSACQHIIFDNHRQTKATTTV